MDHYIVATLGKAIKRERASFSGIMEKCMMDNGKKERSMEVECGRAQKETLTLESGKKGKLKALESLLTKRGIDMRGSSLTS